MNDGTIIAIMFAAMFMLGASFTIAMYEYYGPEEPSLTCSVKIVPQTPEKFVSASLILSGETYAG